MPDILLWLQSIDESERTQELHSLFVELKASSIDAIRVFIGRTQGAYALRMTNGIIDETQMNFLDFLVEQAGLNEMKLILVLADARREIDSLDVFLAEGSLQNPSAEEQNHFFTSAEVQSVFFNWLDSIMSHTNPLTNLALAEDPSIFLSHNYTLHDNRYRLYNAPSDLRHRRRISIRSLAINSKISATVSPAFCINESSYFLFCLIHTYDS